MEILESFWPVSTSIYREGRGTPTPQGSELMYWEPFQTSPYVSLHPAVYLYFLSGGL